METKKPILMKSGHTDDFQTPKAAIYPLIPYLKHNLVIWECAFGDGSLSRHLIEEGFNVIGDKSIDFLNESQTPSYFDCIVTNPPYSLKDEFLSRCYKLKKPFALLLPLTALGGIKRCKLYSKYGIKLIIPNKRINFITPSGSGSGSWFHVAWFCWGINLPNDLVFVELTRDTEQKRLSD